jgi:hypothetical protein
MDTKDKARLGEDFLQDPDPLDFKDNLIRALRWPADFKVLLPALCRRVGSKGI